MKSRIILFVLALAVWAVLCWPCDLQNFIVGVAVSFITALITGDLFVDRPHVLRNVKRYVWFMAYIPIFLWECLKANIDVAYRVSHPDVPIHPGIVKIKTNLKSKTGRTFLANSITLTPGTLSVDIDEENGYLYIHWIEVRDKDVERATKLIAERFEKILVEIFE